MPVLSLLAGCPSSDALSIPADCPVGKVLVAVGGQWECGWPPQLRLPELPASCYDSDRQAPVSGVALSSDGNTFSCSSYEQTLPPSIEEALRALDVLSARVAVVRQGPSYYRGVTTSTSTGAMQAPGAAMGLPSGAALCAAEYPGSHLCSMLEVYDSVAHGRVTKDMRIPKSWIYFPTGFAPSGAVQPTDGLADSCASYTYDKDDRGWSGVAVEWTNLATSYLGLKLYGGSSATCSSSLPLACCGGAP